MIDFGTEASLGPFPSIEIATALAAESCYKNRDVPQSRFTGER